MLGMTYHRKKLMELSDIKGYSFTCKTCGAVVSLPHDVKFQRGRLARCPSCLADWLEATASSQRVVAFEELLRAVEVMQRVTEAAGFNFAVELAPEQDAGVTRVKD